MRLKQVYIRQYGPLQKDLQLTPGLNVIQGPNESGKTLLVDAILKQLADGAVPNPVIDAAPAGFVELTHNGEGYTIGEDGSFVDFCEARFNQSIRPAELRNVFVVKAADLAFHESDEFYSHITDKLTGRRVEDINEITDALLDAGRLTPTRKSISSDQVYHDAGTQLKAAQDLKDDATAYLESARDDGAADAEHEYLTVAKRETELEETVMHFERAQQKAEKQARYEDLVDAKETIAANLETLDELPENDIIEDIDSRLQDLEEADAELEELEDRKARSYALAKWSIAAALASFAVGAFIGFPIAGVITTALFLAVTGYFWHAGRTASQTLTDLAVHTEELLSDARAAGLSFTDRTEIRHTIREIQDTRSDLTNENQGKKAVLERELGFEAESMTAVVEKADRALDALDAEIDDSVDTEFDRQAYEDAKAELASVRERKAELEADLQQHRAQLADFREAAAALKFDVFVGEPLDLEIENLDAVETLITRLEEFITAIEADAESSRAAIEIFEEIQAEEKQKTAELFEEGSRATALFSQITDERYETVTYDNEANRVEVVKATGETFGPDQLSDGTRDQLYLAIRVALGEELLDGRTGFFVMDDALLTSDPTRVATQAQLLGTLVEEGWQILYLSSKTHALSTLSEYTDTPIKKLQSLE